MAILSAYITNLGKYNEGQLVGKWHEFPTTPEEVAKTFQEIGIDGIRYEEFFMTDYETSVSGIYDCLPEYASVDELNYLASKLEDLGSYELEVFEAAVESGEYSGGVQDLINLTDNLDCFDYLKGVENDYDLGYYWVEESGCYDSKNLGSLTSYIDYERFGRDISLDEGGTFTAQGLSVTTEIPLLRSMMESTCQRITRFSLCLSLKRLLRRCKSTSPTTPTRNGKPPDKRENFYLHICNVVFGAV